MVLLHVKRIEKESFLYETPAATDVEVVLRELVTIRVRFRGYTQSAGLLCKCCCRLCYRL